MRNRELFEQLTDICADEVYDYAIELSDEIVRRGSEVVGQEEDE